MFTYLFKCCSNGNKVLLVLSSRYRLGPVWSAMSVRVNLLNVQCITSTYRNFFLTCIWQINTIYAFSICIEIVIRKERKQTKRGRDWPIFIKSTSFNKLVPMPKAMQPILRRAAIQVKHLRSVSNLIKPQRS